MAAPTKRRSAATGRQIIIWRRVGSAELGTFKGAGLEHGEKWAGLLRARRKKGGGWYGRQKHIVVISGCRRIRRGFSRKEREKQKQTEDKVLEVILESSDSEDWDEWGMSNDEGLFRVSEGPKDMFQTF